MSKQPTTKELRTTRLNPKDPNTALFDFLDGITRLDDVLFLQASGFQGSMRIGTNAIVVVPQFCKRYKTPFLPGT